MKKRFPWTDGAALAIAITLALPVAAAASHLPFEGTAAPALESTAVVCGPDALASPCED